MTLVEAFKRHFDSCFVDFCTVAQMPCEKVNKYKIAAKARTENRRMAMAASAHAERFTASFRPWLRYEQPPDLDAGKGVVNPVTLPVQRSIM